MSATADRVESQSKAQIEWLGAMHGTLQWLTQSTGMFQSNVMTLMKHIEYGNSSPVLLACLADHPSQYPHPKITLLIHILL